MDRDARMDQRTPAARRQATWSAIDSSAYLAPARIALDDRRERILSEAAQARLLASSRAAPRSPAGVGCRATGVRRSACLPRRIVGLLRIVMLAGLLGFGGLGSRSPGAEALDSNVGSRNPSVQDEATGCIAKGADFRRGTGLFTLRIAPDGTVVCTPVLAALPRGANFR